MYLLLDNQLFAIPVVSGLILIIAGGILHKFPPKKINAFYGYRTANSMKDQACWDFAQKYSAIEMIKIGSLMSVIGLLGIVFYPTEHIGKILGLGILISMIFLLIFRVEKALKKQFNETKF